MLPLLLAAAVVIGDPLPSLSLGAIPGGARVELPVRGRVTVIDLFATWCVPCRQSLPALERLRRRFDGRVDFVSIAEDDDPIAVERFVRELGVGARVLLDGDRRAWRALGAHRLPTTYLVDGAGVVRRINHGSGPGYEARVAAWIEQLVGTAPARPATAPRAGPP
jgi:thiol-disulfide isomerase/thioredoxin